MCVNSDVARHTRGTVCKGMHVPADVCLCWHVQTFQCKQVNFSHDATTLSQSRSWGIAPPPSNKYTRLVYAYMYFWWNYMYDINCFYVSHLGLEQHLSSAQFYSTVCEQSGMGGGVMSCFNAELVGLKISNFPQNIYLNMENKDLVNKDFS